MICLDVLTIYQCMTNTWTALLQENHTLNSSTGDENVQRPYHSPVNNAVVTRCNIFVHFVNEHIGKPATQTQYRDNESCTENTLVEFTFQLGTLSNPYFLIFTSLRTKLDYFGY